MLKNIVSNRRLNLNQVSSQIIEVFVNSDYLKKSFYLPYLKLTEYKKRRLKRAIELIVREYTFSDTFYIALAKDTITSNGEYNFSAVYLYVRKKFFGGNSKALMMKLYECIGEDTHENKDA